MAKPDENTEPQLQELDFAALLADMGHGASNKIATARLKEVIDACRKNAGKVGGVQITVKIVANADGIIEMKPVIVVKKPEPGLPGGAYFASASGGVLTEDPRQASLPLPRVLPVPGVVNINNGGKAQ
jgi:hypothetical protein